MLTVPEICTSMQNQLSRASDVYAFGMLWWEMVTGQLLWPSLNSEQIHKRVLAKQMPTLPLNMDSGIKVSTALLFHNNARSHPLIYIYLEDPHCSYGV